MKFIRQLLCAAALLGFTTNTVAAHDISPKYIGTNQLQKKKKRNNKLNIERIISPLRYLISGQASYYGPGFNGSPTASGIIFYESLHICASNIIPLYTRVIVKNEANGKQTTCRILDTGAMGNRIIDLSTAVKNAIGMGDLGMVTIYKY